MAVVEEAKLSNQNKEAALNRILLPEKSILVERQKADAEVSMASVLDILLRPRERGALCRFVVISIGNT